MSIPLDLSGQRVLVTGGTKGLGEAIVAVLRDAGAMVLVTARSMPDGLGHPDLFVAADVSTFDGCALVKAAVEERLGQVDIMVHVVGGSSAPAGGYAALTDAEWDKTLSLSYSRGCADRFGSAFGRDIGPGRPSAAVASISSRRIERLAGLMGGVRIVCGATASAMPALA